MTIDLQAMLSDEMDVESEPEVSNAVNPRIGGDDSHAVLCEPAATDDDECDLIDLELQAEEFVAQDAYERGLIFA